MSCLQQYLDKSEISMENSNSRNAVLIKNSILIVVALIFGLVAFFLSKKHLAEKEAELIAQAEQKQQEMMAVVVARSDIVAGEAISVANLAVVHLPAAHVPLDVLTPEEFELVSGRISLRDIPRGKPLLRQYISKGLTERFSDLLEPGQRALTLSVDMLNSNEGMLEAGDRIDLFLLSEKSALQETKELISLLQNTVVIAVGKNTLVPMTNEYGEEVFEDEQYQTFTIAVAPKDAQKVLLAKDSGSIVTLLRNRNDSNQLPASVLGYDTLKIAKGQVQYYTGSAAEAGALKMQIQPVSSITPPPDFPLHLLSNRKIENHKK